MMIAVCGRSINLAFISSIVIALADHPLVSLLSVRGSRFFQSVDDSLWVIWGHGCAFGGRSVPDFDNFADCALSVMGFDERPRRCALHNRQACFVFVSWTVVVGLSIMPVSAIRTRRFIPRAPDYIQQSRGGRSRHHQLWPVSQMQQANRCHQLIRFVAAGYAAVIWRSCADFGSLHCSRLSRFDTMFEPR